MRVDFTGMPTRLATDPFGNRFGLGRVIAGMRGLGETICDEDGNNCVDTGSTQDTGNTQADWNAQYDKDIAGCFNYDAGGDCTTCAPGYSSNGVGGCTNDLQSNMGAVAQQQCQGQGGTWKADGCYFDTGDVCAAAGGTLVNGKCSVSTAGVSATSTSALTSVLNSLSNIFRPTTSTANTAAACATAGGKWNGVQCVPSGSISIGGMVLSSTTLIILGVGAFLLLKKK